MIGDPGPAAAGTRLGDPGQVVDAGLLVGKGYRLEPSAQRWGVRTDGATAAGTYRFMCTVHDVMQGDLTVSH